MAMRIKCPVVPGPGAGSLPVGPGRMFREFVAGAGLERRDLEVSRNKPGVRRMPVIHGPTPRARPATRHCWNREGTFNGWIPVQDIF